MNKDKYIELLEDGDLFNYIIELEHQRDLYKSVIDEISIFVDKSLYYLKGIDLVNWELEKISKILDKAKIKEDRLGGDVDDE